MNASDVFWLMVAVVSGVLGIAAIVAAVWTPAKWERQILRVIYGGCWVLLPIALIDRVLSLIGAR